jgi:hypothetical protein
MMEIRAKAKGIGLTFTAGSNLPKIWGDERAIRQVLLNLPQCHKIHPAIGKSLAQHLAERRRWADDLGARQRPRHPRG